MRCAPRRPARAWLPTFHCPAVDNSPDQVPRKPMFKRSPYPLWDVFFFCMFVLFCLVAFVHEPLFYLYCGWDGLRHDSCTNATIAQIWKGYAQYDRVYFDAPLWMELLIFFDTLLLSPF